MEFPRGWKCKGSFKNTPKNDKNSLSRQGAQRP